MLNRLQEIVLDLKAAFERQPTYGWAVVTSITPLMIRYDAQTEPIAGTPDRLVAGLAIGDRVWCQRIHRRDIILGVAKGHPAIIGQPYAIAAGTATIAGSGVTTIIYPAGRFTQKPVLTTNVEQTTGGTVAVAWGTSGSPTRVDMRIFTLSGSQTSGTVEWQAIQMTEASANS